MTFYRSTHTFLLAICIFSLIAAGQAQAIEGQAGKQVSGAVNAGLRHFLDLTDPDKKISFDPQAVAAVLDFVETPKTNGTVYYTNTVPNLTSTYHDFDVRKNLKTILNYAFNPDIPAIAVMPSSARLFNWIDSGDGQRRFPRLSRYLGKNGTPVRFNGRQFIEITPDLNSGAYYGYDVQQVLLLFQYRRRDVLVTVSKQVDVSTVGKKGYVLGSDNDWDYLYSGNPGLTLPALGWVKSYMYDSRGINIYFAVEPNSPRVRCAGFKWLRAGWSGINMVQKKHIYRGQKRFGRTFKEIVESPQLPPADKLAGDMARIQGLSREVLRSKMKRYSKILKNRYNSGHRSIKKGALEILGDEKHWNQMSRDEMVSTMVTEYMKYTIGKTRQEEVGELLGLRQ